MDNNTSSSSSSISCSFGCLLYVAIAVMVGIMLLDNGIEPSDAIWDAATWFMPLSEMIVAYILAQ